MPDDLLSQNAVDALFSELAHATDAPLEAVPERFRSIRPYDFRHPSKLSKDQLRTMQMIFEVFARLVSTNLSGILRSQVHLALVSIEQSVFDDYARALPQKKLLHLATAAPLPGTFVFEYDVGTAFLIIDRLLGGIGKVPHQERAITEIEEILLQSVSSAFLDALSEAWSHIVPMEAKLQRLEYSARLLQMVPQNDPVVLLLFDLRIHEWSTTVSMCIPYSVIEPVASELNVQALFSAAHHDPSAEESAEAHLRLQRVAIPVTAVLGSTVLPVAAVNDFQLDDIIRLDGHTADPLVVTVNNKQTFVARPGLVGRSIAIQILGLLQDGEAVQ